MISSRTNRQDLQDLNGPHPPDALRDLPHKLAGLAERGRQLAESYLPVARRLLAAVVQHGQDAAEAYLPVASHLLAGAARKGAAVQRHHAAAIVRWLRGRDLDAVTIRGLINGIIVGVVLTSLAVETLIGFRLWAQLSSQSVDSGLFATLFDLSTRAVQPFEAADGVTPIRPTGILQLATLVAAEVYLAATFVAVIALMLLRRMASARSPAEAAQLPRFSRPVDETPGAA